MSTIDMADPIPNIGPAFSAARPEAFLLTIMVPIYNEQDSADPFFDALLPALDSLKLDACGTSADESLAR